MKFIKLIINDIKSGQNLDIYLTVVIAAVIAVLGVFSIVEQAVISSAILATLALIATSSIQNRNERLAIKRSLLEARDDYHSAESFFQEYKVNELKELIRTSKSVYFWGVHFRKTISSCEFALEQSLRNGACLKFLLVKPDSSATKMSGFRNTSVVRKDRSNRFLKDALRDLADIGTSANAIDRIEVKVIDFLPLWTMSAINPKSSDGKILVILSSFRFSAEENPFFQLIAEKDRHWFNFFVEQFEETWKEAETIDLQRHTSRNI